MSRYILDTGILLGYLRGAKYAAYVESVYSPFKSPNTSAISIVSKAELYSLAIQFGWGLNKQNALAKLLREVPQIDINREELFRMYAEIDSYSLGRNKLHPLPSGAAGMKMGKNDLWIAATASVLQATLLTIDHHFDHLDGEFMTVKYVDQSATF
jgi:predicted nucleic acid-binding protein